MLEMFGKEKIDPLVKGKAQSVYKYALVNSFPQVVRLSHKMSVNFNNWQWVKTLSKPLLNYIRICHIFDLLAIATVLYTSQ